MTLHPHRHRSVVLVAVVAVGPLARATYAADDALAARLRALPATVVTESDERGRLTRMLADDLRKRIAVGRSGQQTEWHVDISPFTRRTYVRLRER